MSYSFDPTGTLLANHINNEPHTIAGIDGVSVNYVLFDQGPAFYDTVEIIDSAGNALIKESDYFGIYTYQEATDRLQKKVVGGIAYTDPSRYGTYKFNYNTIGSELVIVNSGIVREALELLHNLNNIPLESISDVPATFPLVEHSQPLSSFEGIQEILNAFEILKQTIANKNVQIKMQDIVDLDTTFIAPLLSSVSEISAGIENLALASNINVRSSHNAGVVEAYQNPDPDTWHDTSLSVVVIVGGQYMVDMVVSSNVNWETISGIVDSRWVADDIPLVESTLKKAVVELSAGTIIKMQYRVRAANAIEISFGDSSSSSALHLTLLNRI